MIDQLVVLLGAGASFDCTWESPYDTAWRPPLVTELFADRESFTEILGAYPDAQTLAPDLRTAVRTGSLGLETYLRDSVLGSALAYDRRRYRSIPPYLQQLLFEVGQKFTTHPTNYDRLINATLRAAKEVLFITLNYDTLLDDRLSRHSRIRALDSYIAACDEWSLYKLHGSVNWGRPSNLVRKGTFLNRLRELPDTEELELGDIELRAGSVDGLRRNSPGPSPWFYPALSVPLGSEDELNCPDSHVDHLRERLAAHGGIHLLSVGYSGLDSSVLRLLVDSARELKTLYVVNAEGESANAAVSRISTAFGVELHGDHAFSSTFNSFASEAQLDAYLERLKD